MKPKNRSHAKSNAAKLPAQTKKQPVETEVPWDLGAAMIVFDENCDRAVAMRFFEANAAMMSLYHLVKHHPKLKKEAASLKLINIGVNTLDRLRAILNDIRDEESCVNMREMAALMWFANYYNEISQLPFTTAVTKLGGFVNWINNPAFDEIGGAVANILIGKAGIAELSRKVDAL